MNYRLIFKLIGNVLRIEALFMLFPLLVSFIYGGGDHPAFLWSILISAAVGTILAKLNPKDKTLEQRTLLLLPVFHGFFFRFSVRCRFIFPDISIVLSTAYLNPYQVLRLPVLPY